MNASPGPSDGPTDTGPAEAGWPPHVARPGPTNSIVDVPGIRVGHAQRREPGWLTGVTVVLAPEAGAVAGVDVSGGAPGTRETDLLDPRAMVDRAHAVVLTGGSAFGLAAADGVMRRLLSVGVGYPMGAPGDVVPIVPAAVIFDLGRGGVFANAPDPALGVAAYDRAVAGGPVSWGCVGAGTGAVAGGLKGGVGSTSSVLADGSTVAAVVVANPFGSCVDLVTGELLAAPLCRPGDLPPLRRPQLAEVEAAREAAAQRWASQPLRQVLATTVAVIATDLTLTKAQCAKVSGVAHDGMARAIRPVHTMVDGDTAFTLATGARGAPDPVAFHALLSEAADCVSRAVARAVVAAGTVTTGAGSWRGYLDAFPSAKVVGASP